MSPFEELSFPPDHADRQQYENAGYWGTETFTDVYERTISGVPETPVVGPNRRLTYAELGEEAARVAAGLQSLGITETDVVSYQLPNWVTTLVIHLAISKVGAIANPIVPIYRHSEVGYILSDADPTCLFVPETYDGFDYSSMATQVADEAHALETIVTVGSTSNRDDEGSVSMVPYDDLRLTDPDGFDPPTSTANDPHMLMYTSGSTGDPKGVVHTHNTLLADERGITDLLDLSADGTIFMPAPITHTVGLWATQLPFVSGMGIVLQDDWDPERATQRIVEEDCTLCIGATPILQGIVEHTPESGSPIEIFACGGADVPPGLIYDATERLDATVFRVYGSTEHPTVTTPSIEAPMEKRATTDGPPAPGVKTRIVDESTGEPVSQGSEGELWVHSPELMVGYNRAELNDKAFEDGWFKTGDLAVIDNDGYLTIIGRKKDVIVRGGEVIPVKDIEDRLYEHPAIEDVAVVPMPDPQMQEKGCAFVTVVDDESFTIDEMRSYLEDEHIAKQKWPERIEVIDEFPRTPNGKIRKSDLRDAISEQIEREEMTD